MEFAILHIATFILIEVEKSLTPLSNVFIRYQMSKSHLLQICCYEQYPKMYKSQLIVVCFNSDKEMFDDEAAWKIFETKVFSRKTVQDPNDRLRYPKFGNSLFLVVLIFILDLKISSYVLFQTHSRFKMPFSFHFVQMCLRSLY